MSGPPRGPGMAGFGAPTRADKSASNGASERPSDSAAEGGEPSDGAVSGDGAGGGAVDIDEVLREEERNRARVFFRIFQIIAVMTLVFVPFLPGSIWLRRAAALGLVAGFATCIFALQMLKRESAYTERLVAVLGVICSVVAVCVVYYIGIFSAAAMALAIGLYFFAASQSRLVAHVIYPTVAILYFVGSAGLSAGLLPDIALFPSSGATSFTRWFQVFMSQVIFGVTFYMARQNRRIMQRAVEHVRAQGMHIRQRDAQLAEARRELDRALRPGDGRRSGEALGPYVLGPLLGRGAMGEVYRAMRRDSTEEVAIKVLHPHLVESEQHKKLFLREAQMALSVTSRHIVKMLDLGEAPDGAPYLVMEMLEGHDLAWHLRRLGKMRLPQVIDIVDQIKNALVTMREAGVVHRDLKPGNLFLTSSEPAVWKVLDFGLSKGLGTTSSMTQDQLLGTPAYMPPEQLRGDVTHLTDLYAVAAIAYRALTGVLPHDGDDVAHMVFKVAYEQPAAPARFARLPSDVELVLSLGMAKVPADRFDTIEAFASALRAASTGDLDDVTRRRGWKLLRRAPWGSSSQPVSKETHADRPTAAAS